MIKLLTIIEELKQYNDQLEKDLAKSKTKINEAETEYGMLMQQYEASMRQNIREGWTQELTLEEYEDDEYGFEVLNNNELKEEEQPLLNDPHL